MARGGTRAGAGRKPDPNSARQKRLAARVARQQGKEPAETPSRGLTLPDGTKSPDAPPGWPFGRTPAPDPTSAPAAPLAEPTKRLTAREYLADLVNNVEADEKLRLDAAKKLIEYEEPKPAPMGKKEARQAAAAKVSKYAAGAAPKLVAEHGNRVA